jgi:hypothetical protein
MYLGLKGAGYRYLLRLHDLGRGKSESQRVSLTTSATCSSKQTVEKSLRLCSLLLVAAKLLFGIIGIPTISSHCVDWQASTVVRLLPDLNADINQ